MKDITVFTDGASRGNPGPGGWGTIVISAEGKVTELGGRDSTTTNNRMELTALLEALRFIRERKYDGDIILYSDSAYALNGISSWVYGWEKNNWQTKDKEPVLNQDLWSALLEVARELKLKHGITWKKIEGHSGIRGNERADAIATSFADKTPLLLFSGSASQHETLIGGGLLTIDSDLKSNTQKTKNTAKAYSYVSLVDGTVHVDKVWQDCKDRVSGKRDVKFRKAISKSDENTLVEEFTRLIRK